MRSVGVALAVLCVEFQLRSRPHGHLQLVGHDKHVEGVDLARTRTYFGLSKLGGGGSRSMERQFLLPGEGAPHLLLSVLIHAALLLAMSHLEVLVSLSLHIRVRQLVASGLLERLL